MPIYFTSRELSERVEKDAQKHANRFRRRTWWASLWLCVGCLGWLFFKGAVGEQRIFEGGQLASHHRFIENDCARCHTKWAPLQRLVSLDFNHSVHSVENKACVECHPGASHHDTQSPKHDDISCAFCHNEHIGDLGLKRMPDSACTSCHRNLDKHFTAPADGASSSFVAAVSTFSNDNGHPEFAVRRLLAASPGDERLGPGHKVFKLLESVEGKDGAEGGKRYRDAAKIKFNHELHLGILLGPNQKVLLERIGLDGGKLNVDLQNLMDGSQVCTMCHQVDPAGRYMQSISFEKHCHQCHKMWVDDKTESPHEAPDVVRGFLTEHFTLQVINSPERFQIEAQDRAVPGRQQRPRLSAAEAKAVASEVAKSEAELQKKPAPGAEELQKLLSQAENSAARRENGVKSTCAKCHELGVAESGVGKLEPNWTVQPTNIPTRWQPHAVFSHQSHQLLNCAECHGLADKDANAKQDYLPHTSVFHSRDTGDVLLPGVALCRRCHSTTPEQSPEGNAPRHIGARAGCVECHIYHDHSKDAFIGHQNPMLGTSRVQVDAILKSQPNDK